jgi:hypothetical protein
VRDVKTCLAGMLRWLGVAADVAASVTGGAPIGVTTDLTNAGHASGDSGVTREETQGEGRGSQVPDPKDGSSGREPKEAGDGQPD